MSSPRQRRIVEWLALAIVLAGGFFLRARDIGAFRLSPDDGNYLWSARVQTLERGFDLSRWIAQDCAWVRELTVGDTARDDLYPHSYLHQWVARCLYRLGLDSVDALRMNSAVWGTATALLLYVLTLRFFPERRRTALLAAALLALSPVHVWYSRTGWGVIGCTFFLLLYSALAWEFLARTPDGHRRKLAKLAIGMTFTSMIAWGYHEMIAPFVVSTGLCVLCANRLADRERAGAVGAFLDVLRARKTWMFVASALPVGLCTLGVWLFSDFAREHWFDLSADATPYWKMRGDSLQFLFVSQRIDRLVTWPVIAAAAFGVVSVYRTARGFVAYLALQNVGASLLFFFLYQDPYLVRIYLPLVILTVWFAAEGLVSVGSDLAARGLKRFAVALPVAICAHLAMVSWVSLFGALDHAMFNRYLYVADPGELREPRHVDEHLTAYLRAHMQPGERVWTHGDKSPIFRLLDAGIRSREFWFEGAPESWPEWLLSPVTLMDRELRTVESGGRYEFVDRDLAGRIGLYRLRRR